MEALNPNMVVLDIGTYHKLLEKSKHLDSLESGSATILKKGYESWNNRGHASYITVDRDKELRDIAKCNRDLAIENSRLVNDHKRDVSELEYSKSEIIDLKDSLHSANKRLKAAAIFWLITMVLLPLLV